jgi:lactocepin
MAPDAQLLVMKVFGKNGGAYDSDYIAAIEDSIVLDCDSCNLSLGSASAGFTYDNVYQDSMNKLISSNTVAAISAGNSYPWNSTNAPYGMLYGENTIFNTVGSPGSYINAFTVAAAQNVGVTGAPFLFGDEKVYYTETDSTGAAMATLDKSADGTGTEYDFVYIDGKGFKEEYAIVDKLDPSGSKFLRNKMVFVNRGTLSFVEKGNNAKTYKPKGLVVVNNTNGSISMALDDYSGTFPFVLCTVIRLRNQSLNLHSRGFFFLCTLKITAEGFSVTRPISPPALPIPARRWSERTFGGAIPAAKLSSAVLILRIFKKVSAFPTISGVITAFCPTLR